MTTIELIFLIVITSFFIFIILMISKEFYDKGYRRGQIDAMNGKNQFVLVEFEDKTRGYYKRSELKNLIEHTIINP